MSKNVKKYVVTALTLGVIAAGSAALIGLSNFITKERIAANATKKIELGLVEIYGNDATFSEAIDIDDGDYLDCYYTANKEEELLGYAFKVTGSNMYGQISMLVGINTEFDIGKIYLIVNEQTYAQTLVDEFVTPYNNGDKKMNDQDVRCGATFGGKLIKAMAEEAQSWASANLKG